MSQPTVKWAQAERYFLRHGYAITTKGGDKFITAPKDGQPRSRQTIRIGHTSSNRPGSQLLPVYLSKFKNIFGVSIDDILNE
jgi:hypothetical protein